MVFKMNKPVVHGSKEHSALLARVPTHGADPTIMAAAADYGKSNSPDVIDWQLTMNKIELAKKEKKEKTKKVEKEEKVKKGEEISLEKEVVGPRAEPSGKKEEETELPDKRWKPDFTKIVRKKITAENDRIAAINRLKLKKVAVDELSDKPIEAIKEYKASYEPGTLQQGSDPNLPPSKNLVKPTVVSKEDVDLGRVVMTKDGYREADWYTKQKKKVTITTQRRKEVEKKTDKPRRWQFKTVKSYKDAIAAWNK